MRKSTNRMEILEIFKLNIFSKTLLLMEVIPFPVIKDNEDNEYNEYIVYIRLLNLMKLGVVDGR